MNNATNNTVFFRLCPGMQVQIETRLYKTRLLTVTEAPQKIGSSWYIFVQSSKVRPGHRAGGSLKLEDDGRMLFQPTLQQQVDVVSGFQLVGDEPRLHS